MDKRRVALESLGCKLNYSETVQIGKEFRRRGFEVVDSTVPADIFVINTCTVTSAADSDCRQVVRRALRASPDAFVVVTGCYAQGKPDQVAGIDGVDLVLGAREKFNLFDYLGDMKKQATQVVGQESDIQASYHARVFAGRIEDAVEFGAADSAAAGTRTRAFLKVQDGCSYNCSYCTIPRVRGISRSPSVAFLVSQAKEIASCGFKEIVLSGVNVGDFKGSDGDSLIALLTELEKVEGIQRIRISSIEPNLLTKEIVKFVAASAKYCKHFHIPLQNGSDEILRKMRRRYNSAQYREIVEYVKEVMPSAGIGADIIVGFPGETAGHFEENLSFVEGLPLSYLHVFSYSERDGTDAARFDKVVDPRVRKKRSEVLRVLSAQKRYEFNKQYMGRIMKILVEEEVRDGKMFGFTSNYIRVEIDSSSSRANEICDVLITGVSDSTVTGRVIL